MGRVFHSDCHPGGAGYRASGRAEFDGRNQQWADEVVRSIEKQSEQDNADRRKPPLIS